MPRTSVNVDGYLTDFRVFEDCVVKDQPSYFKLLRKQSIDCFSKLGFPVTRKGNEEWKYTNILPLARAGFRYPFESLSESSDQSELLNNVPFDKKWINLVFVDGRYNPELSNDNRLNNDIVVENLRVGMTAHYTEVKKYLTSCVAFNDNAFVALNTAFFNDGAFVYIPDNYHTHATINIISIISGSVDISAFYPRNLIVVGQNSQATVIETYIGPPDVTYLTNGVTEISIGKDAQLFLHRLTLEGNRAFHVGATHVNQDSDSELCGLSFSKGSLISRNNLSVQLDSPGSTCLLSGLYIGCGNEHIDNNVNVCHQQPNTKSRLYYKGVLEDSSRAIFGGTVLVAKDAQKSDSQQTDKNLLLSKDAEVDSKPSLLIYADDVKCSHGATSGYVDEESLFYLTSRGLDEVTAKDILVRGFASDVIDGVTLPTLKTYLETSFMDIIRQVPVEASHV